MQNFRNYYQILGVSRDASIEEIKRVYRRLARQYHPDLNPGDKAAEDKFKDVGEAYEILSDPNKRAQYDQFSRFWKMKGFQNKSAVGVAGKAWGGDRRSPSDKFDYSRYPDFNDFLDQLLNRRRERQAGMANGTSTRVPPTSADYFRPGTTKKTYTIPTTSSRRDVEARLTLPLEKAYSGGTERIRLEDGRSLEVEMPPGMTSNQRVLLRNQGIGGGDLYLKITVAPHRFFQLEGANIICQVPVTPSEAVLGGEIQVPTLDGLVKMKVRPGVRHGERLWLANKGYPDPEIQGKRGDQIVEIQIAIPEQISTPERELYEKLRQMETFAPRRDLLGS